MENRKEKIPNVYAMTSLIMQGINEIYAKNLILGHISKFCIIELKMPLYGLSKTQICSGR